MVRVIRRSYHAAMSQRTSAIPPCSRICAALDDADETIPRLGALVEERLAAHEVLARALEEERRLREEERRLRSQADRARAEIERLTQR
jgi:hypothetical protein